MSEKPHREPDEIVPETGSAASRYQPEALRETALGKVEPANTDFNRSASAEEGAESPIRSSEQVGNAAPEPRLKPPAALDRAGAVGAHKERMAQDDLASKLSPRQQAVYDAAKQRMEAERGGLSQHPPGMDR